MQTVFIKRVYDAPSKGDGMRILIDRLWPRGLSKEKAKIDVWMKEIAPSTQLRKWFGHEPEKWDEFRKRYLEELKENKKEVEQLIALTKKGTVTLVFGAKDTEHNDAVVLYELLTSKK